MSLSVKCRIYLAIKMSYCGLRAILDVASSIRSQSSALKPSLPITTLLVIPHKNLKDKREQVAICKAELHQDYICIFIYPLYIGKLANQRLWLLLINQWKCWNTLNSRPWIKSRWKKWISSTTHLSHSDVTQSQGHCGNHQDLIKLRRKWENSFTRIRKSELIFLG